MNILSLQNSISGDASVTRALSAAYIARLRENDPGATLVEHDLVAEAFPHLTDGMVPVTLGLAHAPSPSAALGDRMIAELERADVIVFGAPFYNFSMPSTLKAWFDYVMRAGRTFRYVDGAPQGLLAGGKKAVVFVASGGVYTEGPGAQVDFLEPHLRWLLRFIGITDVTLIRAEGLAHGAEAIRIATGAARDQALALAG